MTRSEAIEHLKNIAIYSVQDGYTDEARQALDMAIKALEEPERKKGKWICKYLPASIGSKVFVEVNICSNCGYVVEGNNVSNFCPVCGSDMRGEQDGRDS